MTKEEKKDRAEYYIAKFKDPKLAIICIREIEISCTEGRFLKRLREVREYITSNYI